MVKNLLKKVCLVVSVLLGLGSNVQAQETSVTFNVSDEGKTLTISGQGDLTTHQAVSDELKFTIKGAEKVGIVNNQFYNSPVGTSAVYNEATSYYAYYPKKIASLYPDYVNAKSVTTSWNEDKLENLYYYGQNTTTDQWEWMKVNSSDAIHDSDEDCAWADHKKYSNYSTTQSDEGRILFDTFVSEYIVKTLSGVSFKNKNNLYVISDNKYVKLAEDAVYDENETYYYWDESSGDVMKVNFGAITQEEMIRMGYLEHPTEGVAQMLNYMLTKSNTYEKIQFANVGTGAMTINKDIVKAILYPSATANSVLTTLDLGAATCKDFSKETFAANGAQGYSALETLTLPLNESKETPAQVVFYLQGQNFKLTHVIVPEGYEKIGANTFDTGGGVTLLTNVTLPNSLTEIGEKAFLYAGKLASIELGANLTYIGKEAFVGTGLTSISFPKNLDKIDDGAFWELKKLLVIELNDNLRYIGKGAFGCSGDLADKSKTQTTIKIPASVKYIGAYAFSERKFQDIYFLGKVAPVCPVGDFFDGQTTRTDGTAFTGTDDKVHYGNSGFSLSGSNGLADNISEGYANRENYVNGGYYFTILHYPADATDEDTFTDTTRKYDCRVKENGTIDLTQIPVGTEEAGSLDYREATHVQTSVDPGYADTYLGTQYVWPSHAQFVRAYATAANGVKWNGKDVYAPDLGDDVKAVLKEAGYDTNDENLANLAKIAYVGTRKFTISNDDSKSTPEYKIRMKPGQWWTLCVPFNMTKKQVLDTFGADTQLCLFNKVTRDLGVNGKNKIVLYFTQDVLKHSTKNADGTKMKDANGMWSENIAAATDYVAEDDVVLWAHESYMIKPYNGEQSDQDPVFVVKNYEAVEGNPLPTVVQSTTTVQSRQASETKEYRFVGNYLGNENARATKVTIPQYSYVYANTNSDPVYKFRFYTGNTSTWKPNKSLVQTNDRNGGMDDYNNFFGIDKSTPLPAGSKQASVFGGENFGETTGIEDVTIVAGTDTLTPVFNLEGKMVSANGDAAGLPAGIYVKNGQKFMVK